MRGGFTMAETLDSLTTAIVGGVPEAVGAGWEWELGGSFG